jgi:uncharacterized protein DUF6894
MPRYFFDIHNGRLYRDPEGSEWTTLDEARQEAMRALPEIARHAVPMRDEDHQAFTVLVRDEQNNTIYTAALTFAGLWVNDPPVDA